MKASFSNPEKEAFFLELQNSNPLQPDTFTLKLHFNRVISVLGGNFNSAA